MKIAQERVVSIHYTLTDDAGQELDSSAGGEPLSYLHGVGGLVPGLERELEGRKAGDQFSASIEPKDAYGEVNPELIHEVPLNVLAEIENLCVGMQLESRSPDGRVYKLTVDAIGDTTATLNANHMLAGKTLHFEVEVTDVRAATPEELEHGHAH